MQGASPVNSTASASPWPKEYDYEPTNVQKRKRPTLERKTKTRDVDIFFFGNHSALLELLVDRFRVRGLKDIKLLSLVCPNLLIPARLRLARICLTHPIKLGLASTNSDVIDPFLSMIRLNNPILQDLQAKPLLESSAPPKYEGSVHILSEDGQPPGRSFNVFTHSAFWDDRLPNNGAPKLDVNNSMLTSRTAGAIMMELDNLPGQKLVWIASSKAKTENGARKEAISGLFSCKSDRVSLHPLHDTRGFCDLRVTIFPLANGMEQVCLKDDQFMSRAKRQSARTTSIGAGIAAGDESFTNDFLTRLHEGPNTTMFANKISATNASPAFLTVVRFPLNYDVLNHVIMCKALNHRKPFLRNGVYKCSHCKQFIQTTISQSVSYASNNTQVRRQAKSFSCASIGLKCRKQK